MTFSRVGADGNCLFRSVSTLLIGNESLSDALRQSTASELLKEPGWYAFHHHFDKVSATLKNSSAKNLFVEGLSDIGCNEFSDTKSRICAVQVESKHISNNFTWASFICVMALSNVIQVSFLLENCSVLLKLLRNAFWIYLMLKYRPIFFSIFCNKINLKTIYQTNNWLCLQAIPCAW